VARSQQGSAESALSRLRGFSSSMIRRTKNRCRWTACNARRTIRRAKLPRPALQECPAKACNGAVLACNTPHQGVLETLSLDGLQRSPHPSGAGADPCFVGSAISRSDSLVPPALRAPWEPAANNAESHTGSMGDLLISDKPPAQLYSPRA